MEMAETATHTAVTSSGPSFATRRRIEGWLLVLPALLLILGLSILPLIQSLLLSFQRWDLQSQEHPFVGLQNYRDALVDPRVWGHFRTPGSSSFAPSRSSFSSVSDSPCSSSATSRASDLRCRS